MLTVMGRGATDANDGPAVIATSLRLLAEAPVRIERATAGVDAARLHRRTADEPWSVNDILAHVRSAADVRERFIDAMSTGEHATLRYVSPRSELRSYKCSRRGKRFLPPLPMDGRRPIRPAVQWTL